MRTVCAAIIGLICMLNIARAQVAMLTEQQPSPMSVAVQNLPAHPVSSSHSASLHPPEPQLASDCVARHVATCTTQACNCSHGHCRGQCRGRHRLCWMPDYWGSSAFYHMPAFGASVRSTLLAQIEEGKAARLVLYRFDFGPEGSDSAGQLNRYGLTRLHRLVPLIAESGGTLVVEPSRNSAELDQARRSNVIQELGRLLGGTVPNEQVVVATPSTRAAHGTEAILHTSNRLRRAAEERVIEPSPGSFRPSSF